MVTIVAPLAEDELDVVLLELQRSVHLLFGQGPVAVLVVQVAGAALQEDAQWFALGLASQCGIVVTAADVSEAAHVTHHFTKHAWPLPRYLKRAGAANRVTVGTVGDVVLLAHRR